MSKQGRPPTVPYDELIPQLQQMRSESLPGKTIAARIGLSQSRVYFLCKLFGIKKQFKRKRLSDLQGDSGYKKCGTLRPQEAQSEPAASDSAPSNARKGLT